MYQKQVSEVEALFHTNKDNGLGIEDAKQRLAENGYNELEKPKKDSFPVKLANQLKDPLIIVLIAASVISLIVDYHEWVDSLIIFIVVCMNAILGILQENSAEKSLEALQNLSSPTCKVKRDGKMMQIPSRELVVGDLVFLEAGDAISSDGRIVESVGLQVDEAALTGESLPVNKQSEVIQEEKCPLGDQKNMVFASTVCTYGRGSYIVTSTGMKNEVGKIAGMLLSAEKQTTPLQHKLEQISKIIGFMCLGICIVVFGFEILSGLSILDAFKTSVALAVAAIPEGLATVVTIVLSIGVTKMVKQHAIVRKLPAVETLGSASVVCSDKTGTLTQNKMTVVKTFSDTHGILEFGKESEQTKLLRYFTLCSDASIKEENGKIIRIGDPTEIAMVEASAKLNEEKGALMRKYPRLNEIAFDSNRKLMTVFVQEDDHILQITKGAPDVIFARSINESAQAVKANEEMASEALRVLGVAIKTLSQLPQEITSESCEKDLNFVGLIGIVDPPRPEVKEAIKVAKQGGIQTVMITGDHITTASAIASQLGILNENQIAVTGTQLDEMDDDTLAQKLDSIRVYARVAPEHKVRIVKAWQSKGNVVAMTGDGVNDSPALKTADIGCAMGITGTDVSKNAADMILTDDNFATIIQAVKQGRGIYQNIKKDVQFLLSSNIGEVLTIFLASAVSLFGIHAGVPLLPIHLLWINLITDTLPAFALGMEEVDPDVMKQRPRAKDESFFANGLGFTIVWQGIMIGAITLTAYFIGNRVDHSLGQTMAFMTLAVSQLFHAFNIKSEKTIFHKHIFNNRFLWFAWLIGFGLQIVILYTPLANIFKVVPLNPMYFTITLGLSLLPVVIVEACKAFHRKDQQQ